MKTVSGQARNLRTLLNHASEAKHSGKGAIFLNAYCGIGTQIVHKYLKMHTYYLINSDIPPSVGQKLPSLLGDESEEQ